MCAQTHGHHQHSAPVQLAKSRCRTGLSRRRTGLSRQVDILALSGQVVWMRSPKPHSNSKKEHTKINLFMML